MISELRHTIDHDGVGIETWKTTSGKTHTVDGQTKHKMNFGGATPRRKEKNIKASDKDTIAGARRNNPV